MSSKWAAWLFLLWPFALAGSSAAELYRFPSLTPPEKTLVIYSSTDVERMEIVIKAFQALIPGVAIDYHELSTHETYQRVIDETGKGKRTADMAISSAMDLQIKLVNDGYTTEFRSEQTDALPDWANWRNEAFGFTYEPAVMVYNKTLAPDLKAVTTRYQLARMLISNPARFQGKVTAYDPAQSGLGYLFHTQDAVQSADFWYLVRSLGDRGVFQTASSSAMIKRVADGSALVAYNVLGSYAFAQAQKNPDLAITLPSDYTLVMSRLVVLLKNGRQSETAGQFLDFLLSFDGQKLIAGPASLYSLREDIEGDLTISKMRSVAAGPLIPIKLGPGLLVYLDKFKRRNFLERRSQATAK